MSQALSEIVEYQDHVAGFLDRVTAGAKIPGMCVAVSVKGHRMCAASGVIGAGGRVPMSDEIAFEIGCLTKLLLAMVALQLQGEGRLNLSLPLCAYLPELERIDKAHEILVAHLLSHTSGYQTMLNGARREQYSWEAFTEHFASAPQLFRPGTVFSYSHTETVILERIIARICNQNGLDALRERILDALGLTAGDVASHDAKRLNSAHHLPDRRSRSFVRSAPASLCEFWRAALSTLTLSTSDLVTIGESLVAAGGPAVRNPLPLRESCAALSRAVVTIPNTTGGAWRERTALAYGMGCGCYGRGLWGRNAAASGQTLVLRYDPAASLVVAVGMNAHDPNILEQISAAILSSLGVPEVRSAQSQRPPPDELTAAELVGRYVGISGVDVAVSREGEGLVCVIGGEAGGAAMPVAMGLAADGSWVVRSEAKRLALGFFREPHAGTPCLLLGQSAFKRV